MTWTKGGAVACSHDLSQCSSPAEIAILPSIIDIDMETKIAPVIGTWRHVKPCTITVLLALVLQVYTVSRVAGSVPGWAELSHCCHRWHGSSPGDLHLHLLVQGWLLATSSDPWLLLVLAWLLHQSEYWLCTAPAQTWVEEPRGVDGASRYFTFTVPGEVSCAGWHVQQGNGRSKGSVKFCELSLTALKNPPTRTRNNWCKCCPAPSQHSLNILTLPCWLGWCWCWCGYD